MAHLSEVAHQKISACGGPKPLVLHVSEQDGETQSFENQNNDPPLFSRKNPTIFSF